ncbi:MAG: LemA family protein [Oscillospiraceae bacterium]|jgi:LemA protein|nr:LemA family protein [Oscillospiraceae bacterium]
MRNLSKRRIISTISFSILGLLLIWFIVGYNSLVSSRENTIKQQSNIQTQLQRRLDLIPNIVNTVKGYTVHESEIIKSVSDARSRLAGASNMSEKAEANAELSSAFSRLLMIAENYPDLKANQNFIALSDELSGTENRITVARKDYNEAATIYNKSVKTFPTVILASMFSFNEVEYFSAGETVKDVPKVEF